VTDVVEIVTAAGSDLDRIGWTTADPFPEVRDEIERRVGSGESGRLGFTFSDPARATDPRSTWPWARSIVVGLHSYMPEAGHPTGPGRVARFAATDRYRPLRAAMARVADGLTGAGFRAEVVIDDSRLVDRAAAHRSGLGWWGKNTMLLTPGLGPWFLIGCVVTDVDFPESKTMRRDCGTCEACLPACPTGALIRPGVLDARRCLAAILQAPGHIPAEYRSAVGDRLYGCDDCIEACPPGTRLLGEATDEPAGGPVEVLTMSDREILERFGHFYLPGGQARYLRRNALVVIGNTGEPAHLPILAGYLLYPDDMLRDHARWAIAAIGGSTAERLLELDQSEGRPSGK
jgi:epoxyqueuosine reductase